MAKVQKNWTILEVLDWTRDHFEKRHLDTPRLDAEVLLASALGIERVMLYARFDQPLGKAELERIRNLVRRRSQGEPIAYLLGEREFWSMTFEVTPDVLVPRPDTETLVEVGLRTLKNRREPLIADVGTGTGCVALAIAKEITEARVFALDASEAACSVARRNALRHGANERVTVIRCHLLEGLAEGRAPLDLICANLPYVPTRAISALMQEVRDFEPRIALDGGEDGLDLIRQLIKQARAHLKPGGTLALEVGHDQSEQVVALLTEAGYASPSRHKDHGNHYRVADATWPVADAQVA